MDIKRHLLYFGLILTFNILCSLAGFGVGYSVGNIDGLKEGQADALMQNAGKCFKHASKEIR